LFHKVRLPFGQVVSQYWHNDKREETQKMSGIFSPSTTSTLEVPQILSTWGERHAELPPGQEFQQPMVIIKGDISLRVTESEAAHQLIMGRYHIETEGLQEPLHLLWYAEGKVLHRQARSTAIAFDLRGTPAGQTHIYQVAVQVVERGGRGRVVQCGVFVQIVVTSTFADPTDQRIDSPIRLSH
jgi:hypothetical protein